MLLALLRMVWVNNADWGAIIASCMERHVWALAILGQASMGTAESCWMVVRVFPSPGAGSTVYARVFVTVYNLISVKCNNAHIIVKSYCTAYRRQYTNSK